MIYPGITPVVCDVIRPRKFVRTVDWAAANITLPPGSDRSGAGVVYTCEQRNWWLFGGSQ